MTSSTWPSPSIMAAWQKVREELLESRTQMGHWVGELSSSALSTATAVSALTVAAPHLAADEAEECWRLVGEAVPALVDYQNADGGWGDTRRSLSNIATTMLAVAALELVADHGGENGKMTDPAAGDRAKAAVVAAHEYIKRQGGSGALRARYGRDKTFAVPILMNYALAGQVAWSAVSPLPFELACFPQTVYRWLRLPVVSYAIPALVAVGQSIYFHNPPGNPITRILRRLSIDRSLAVLAKMQPASGGYLEAIPLTSFVVMSLATTGRANHAVTQNGIRFLMDTVRPDGSWPIDTNLATWVTSLAVHALDDQAEWDRESCLRWLLRCQQNQKHPFTGATPGGWGWTDLSGAVPDADDTPGAMLALQRLVKQSQTIDEQLNKEVTEAVKLGGNWLMKLQNRDGGWPTFCRGWGQLPFDRSGCDLTAHVLRALHECESTNAPSAWQQATQRGWAYLRRTQNADGSWTPLWFGNQFHPQEENPIYGTAKVLLAFADTGRATDPAAMLGGKFLIASQSASGGWGAAGPGCRDQLPANVVGDDSVEETALAVEALFKWSASLAAGPLRDQSIEAAEKGAEWLCTAIRAGRYLEGSPIGLYFAKLWYSERLYPLTFATAALQAAAEATTGVELDPRREKDSIGHR